MSVALDRIVDVSIQVSNPAAIQSDFSLGLIIGNSNDQFKGKYKVYNHYDYQTTMVADGFATTDPTYKKAVAYFSQNPKAKTLAVAGMNDSETYDNAFTRIRGLSDKWYSFCFTTDPSESQALSVAALVEAAKTPTQFIFRTADENCLKSGTQQVLSKIQASKYTRTFGFYGTDVNLDAAVMGMISGHNSAKNNSAYTAAYKSLVGVTADNLTGDQLTNLTSYNGNAYTNFGNKYDFVYPGISAGSYHFDEIYLIDSAKFYIQQYVVSGMTSMLKVPQAEDGISTIVSFVQQACMKLNQIGLISSGIWKADPVLNLETGDAVPDGFYIQYGSIADQTAAEKASRISPPIYVALLSSGAIEHVVIDVYVER